MSNDPLSPAPVQRSSGRLSTTPGAAVSLDNPSSPYLTLAEAAAYARCSKRTVQRWLEAKKLNRYGHGRTVLIHRRELELLLAAGPRDSAAPVQVEATR